MAFDPPVHLFGGVSEDALLHSDWVRPHDDIDILVERPHFPAAIESSRGLGFQDFEVRFQPFPDTPVVVGCIQEGNNLEISICDRDDGGRVFFYMVEDTGGVVRVQLADGVFDHPAVALDGVEVRTVSPLAQYQIRSGIALAGGFGALRPKDILAQRELQERFFPGIDPEDLAPVLLPL